MTTLLLDIGNSRLKWGVLRNDRIRCTGQIPLEDAYQDFDALRSNLPQALESAIACNVAGSEIRNAVTCFLNSAYGVVPRFVTSTATAGDVRNAYRAPAKLGVDRWVALIGARATTASACLIADAGTAITLDALDPTGQHLGGQILPGLNLMAQSLTLSTNDLPSTDVDLWRSVDSVRRLSTSTDDAIVQGILSSVLSAIESGFQSLTEMFPGASLLLTGGDADVIQKHLQVAADVRPNLVLEGLARLVH